MAEEQNTPSEGSAAKSAAAPDATPPADAEAKPARGRGKAKPKDRIEVFDAVRPDGKTVTITRNIDTGEQTTELQE